MPTLVWRFHDNVAHRVVAQVARIQLGTGHLGSGSSERVTQVKPVAGGVLVEVSASYPSQRLISGANVEQGASCSHKSSRCSFRKTSIAASSSYALM
jgi:hypothetical protein